MRLPRALLSLPLFAAAGLLAGCPTEPAGPAKDPRLPEDEWSRTPPSKEWLYATSEFNGPHKAECEHVLGWIKGEEQCTGAMCEHGRDLASEWMTRCKPLVDGASVNEVQTLRDQLAARATGKLSECGKSFQDLVRDGCGDDKTCATTGQRWATRCAKSDGTPLVMRILQRAVERRQEQGAGAVVLDPRTCDELRNDLFEAAKCKDRFTCSDAIPKVETYQARCDSDDNRPTIAVAALELTVIVGGGKPGPSILVRQGSPQVNADDLPVALGDGSGAIISICEERATTHERFLAGRKGCQGGKLIVARAFPTSRGLEMRAGSLDFPDDATFSARYPTIVSARELELRDREAAALLGTELAKAAELARTSAGAAEAGRLVAKAVVPNALAIRRSVAVRKVLEAHDAQLGPAFKEIARAKIAASRQRLTTAEKIGLLQRAQTRAFADLAADGTVQVGVSTRAFMMDTVTLFPRAMEAYAAALKSARPPRPDGRTAKAEKARGFAAATTCGASLKRLHESKKSLVNCDFGLETCDPAKRAQLLKSVDEARAAAETAFQELEGARTGAAVDEADALHRAAQAAGCREPWW